MTSDIDEILARYGYRTGPRFPISRYAILAARQRRQERRENTDLRVALEATTEFMRESIRHNAAVLDMENIRRENASLQRQTRRLTTHIENLTRQVANLTTRLRGQETYQRPQINYGEVLSPCSGGAAIRGTALDPDLPAEAGGLHWRE